MSLDAYNGIWVIAESNEAGQLLPITLESMTAATQLAEQTSQSVTAIILAGTSQDTADTESKLGQAGATEVLTLKHDLLGEAQNAFYTTALANLIDEKKPAIVLTGHTSCARDFMPRLAARTQGGLIPDATALSITNGQLQATRPMFGQNLVATVNCNNVRPQFATLRIRSFPQASLDAGKSATVTPITPNLSADMSRVTLVNRTKPETKAKKLEEADIIVSGGRGLKGPENFNLVEDLASAFDAAVGASRAVVDAGWRPHSEQVGQTGKTVSPNVYVAIAISGAIQHLVGMGSSKHIIAINKDPDAPIFEVADMGVVGDAFDIVPALTQKVKDKKLAASSV